MRHNMNIEYTRWLQWYVCFRNLRERKDNGINSIYLLISMMKNVHLRTPDLEFVIKKAEKNHI